MEIVLSAAIGILAASGAWLLMRPRTFQVIVGLCLLSYAVNLFIFSMGRLTVGAPAIMPKGGFVNPDAFADPIPQALVLTEEPRADIERYDALRSRGVRHAP